jgi:predicted GNAT superfamily acetyltransferase
MLPVASPEPSPADDPGAGGSGADLAIRPLESLAECHACVDLQREVWGVEFDEIVPASLMLAAGHVGALALGAFSPEGELQGFVFGLTGVKGGAVAHWSHMLGVRPAVRNRGIGRRLKEYQRAELARRGIARMYWTFDPLQARNAHLNLNRLGVRVVEYVTDMYGSSHSPLHHASPTDRLIVECLTTVEGGSRALGEVGGAPVLTPFLRAGDVAPNGGRPPIALIEIPWDLEEETDSAVGAWRTATRGCFEWALGQGYHVTGLHRNGSARRAFFVIEQPAV